MVWRVALAIGVCLLVVWVGLMITLRVVAPDRARLGDAMRLLPDLVRLTHRLARDRSLPRGVRARLALLLVYLALPIDLVPDFIPVIGYADDAVIVAIVLRSVVKRAGPDSVAAHWPGTPDGLASVYRLTRTAPPGPPGSEAANG